MLTEPTTLDAQPEANNQADAPQLLHLDRVTWTDTERLSGAPCFYKTRVPVKSLFDYLEGGESITTFLDDFPGVTRAQVLSAIYYGKAQLMPPGVPQPTGKTRTVPQPVFQPST